MRDNTIEVAQARGEAKDTHLAKDDTRSVCPTGSGYFFPCACVKESLASRYKPKRGLKIFCSSAAVITTMVNQWFNLVSDKHGFIVYVDTGDKLKELKHLGVALWNYDTMKKWKSDKFGRPPDNIGDVILFCNPGNWSRKWKPNEDKLLRECFGDWLAPGRKDKIMEKIGMGRENFVSDLRAYQTKKNVQFVPIRISLMILDEAHTYHGNEHGLIKWLNASPVPIDLFPQTGTPFNNDGLDLIESWINLMIKHGGTRGPDLARLSETNKKNTKAVKEKDVPGLAIVLSDLSKITDQCGMIKRDYNTIWPDGKCPVFCPETEDHDIHVPVENDDILQSLTKL